MAPALRKQESRPFLGNASSEVAWLRVRNNRFLRLIERTVPRLAAYSDRCPPKAAVKLFCTGIRLVRDRRCTCCQGHIGFQQGNVCFSSRENFAVGRPPIACPFAMPSALSHVRRTLPLRRQPTTIAF